MAKKSSDRPPRRAVDQSWNQIPGASSKSRTGGPGNCDNCGRPAIMTSSTSSSFNAASS